MPQGIILLRSDGINRCKVGFLYDIREVYWLGISYFTGRCRDSRNV